MYDKGTLAMIEIGSSNQRFHRLDNSRLSVQVFMKVFDRPLEYFQMEENEIRCVVLVSF